VNNQQYYNRDLPAKAKGDVAIRISGLSEGTFRVQLRQVGYGRNDAYTAYIAMGSPAQLTKAQVEALKTEGSGSVLEQREIRVSADGIFRTQLPLRENDVYLIELTP
jgi:xylan 1,4-beta-xylosidase